MCRYGDHCTDSSAVWSLYSSRAGPVLFHVKVMANQSHQYGTWKSWRKAEAMSLVKRDARICVFAMVLQLPTTDDLVLLQLNFSYKKEGFVSIDPSLQILLFLEFPEFIPMPIALILLSNISPVYFSALNH
jgi:hypothetical protein